MKISLLPLVLLLSFLKAEAQKPEFAVAEVRYKFVYVRDTTERNSPYTENLLLYLSNTSSAYKSFDAMRNKELVAGEIREQFKNAADPNKVDLTITGTRPVTSTEYFQYIKAKKLYVKQNIGNHAFLYEEILPTISWTINTDTMTINGLKCQKATAAFRGRQYVAWFCPEIPFHTGPWKLNGLPGLIVQANDAKKEVNFIFDGLKDVRNSKIEMKLPEDVSKVSKADFTRLENLEKKDPEAFFKIAGQSTDSGPFSTVDRSKIKSININSVRVPFSNRNNNPIELSENE